MYHIKVHEAMNGIILSFYRLRLWHRGNNATVKENTIKLFYSIYHFLFPISILIGAVNSENTNECISLTQTAILATVMSSKFSHIIWKKKEIIQFLHQFGVFSTEDHGEFTYISRTLNSFMKINMLYFFGILSGAIGATLFVPFIAKEKKLFLSIGFPLDYKSSNIAYWMAFLFFFTEGILCAISTLFTIIMWYILINFSLQYKVLGSKLRNMGEIRSTDTKNNEIAEKKQQNIFLKDLISGIHLHQEINGSTEKLGAFLTNILSLQLFTSGICICSSIYCLAFNSYENVMEFILYLNYLFYSIFDIFMVMYFGNEITIYSNQLSYCLFESNWIEQPQSCKNCVLIFGECLKRRQQLIILKLYPVTTETFIRILKSAYTMFNILKDLNK